MVELKLTYTISISILDVVKKDMKELRAIVNHKLDRAGNSMMETIEAYKRGVNGG